MKCSATSTSADSKASTPNASLILGVSALLAGCSILSPDLISDRLAMGETSQERMICYLGQPSAVDTLRNAGFVSLMSSYDYNDKSSEPPEVYRGAWQVPRRTLFLEFVNDTLHAYLYNNSVDRHSTDFNKKLRWRIRIGRSTKDSVLSVLGEPAGKVILPTATFSHPSLKHIAHVMPSTAAEAWCYYYDYFYFKSGVRRRFEFYRFLSVYFNHEGTVIDKFYGESDKTEPKFIPVYPQ